MKNRIHKIMGVGITLVIAMALVMGFAAPVAASPGEFEGTPQEWTGFVADRGADSGWFLQGSWTDNEHINKVGPIAEAINGDLYAYVELRPYADDTDDHIFKSTDGARSWADTGYTDVEVWDADDHPDRVRDMVCSSIDEDIVYATDGGYVYKTTDGGDTWDFVARDSLETVIGGDCGCDIGGDNECAQSSALGDPPITSIDVVYNDDDNPFVYIGTRAHDVYEAGDCSDCISGAHWDYPGDVFYIGEAGYPANWTSLNLACFRGGGYSALAVGCAPDWADTHQTYVVVSSHHDGRTFVVYTTGTICGWYEFAELKWDCTYEDDILYASRIAFPDDWEDTGTLFVGVVEDYGPCECGEADGNMGDVYMAMDGVAYDMNVAGIDTGCEGLKPVNIISLDIEGDTDEARLIAGAYCNPFVYCSEDGGWSWDKSAKEPTGNQRAHVIWYGDTALAATWGDECAVSMCCGEDFPCEFWNQISLIATDIDEVYWIDHSPGYVCEGSETIFMLSTDWGSNYFDYQDICGRPYEEVQSLFRYDGTYWERVYASFIAGADTGTSDDTIFQWVEVSPDFNDTNTVYLANHNFEMWRTQDAGCSWDKLTFPCTPREEIGTLVVIDEDTVIAGGRGSSDRGKIFKTTRHGSRPWSEYEATDAKDAKSFALEPGYEDPGSVLLGTENLGQVFISEDGGETWDLVGDCTDVLTGDAYVIFDPAYATNGIIYAAGGDVIARCIIDPDADWADQAWEEICHDPEDDNHYRGIAAAGDTALYVTDQDEYDESTDGGVLRSLNPDAEDAGDVVFERLVDGLDANAELGARPGYLWLTCDTSADGCPENVLWSLELDNGSTAETIWVWEDTLAAPIVLAMPIDEQKLTTTDSATLSWNELCGADCYEVALWKYCAECPDEKLSITVCGDCAMGYDCVACYEGDDLVEPCIPGVDCCTCHTDTCIVLEGLESGTEYYWQVRVCQCKPYLSKWSEVRTFKTALVPIVDLCSPACGGQNIILTPNFSWDEVDGATGYDIELATTETFTAGVIRGSSTVNAWVAPEDLEYSETYYWRVRAEKDGVFSDWTVCIFTTMGRPEAPPPPVTVEQVPPPQITVEVPVEQIAPNWIYAVIGIGAALVVVVIVLIARTRRTPA